MSDAISAIFDGVRDPFEAMEHNTECELFGTFGVIVQICLGILSFSSLFAKRHYEYPKRSYKTQLIKKLLLFMMEQKYICVNLVDVVINHIANANTIFKNLGF